MSARAAPGSRSLPRHRSRLAVATLWLTCALGTAGCFDVIALRPELRAAAAQQNAIAVADGLQELIDEQQASEKDRKAAYKAVREWPIKTAADAYARAALAGRLAQVKGLAATHLVAEVEKYALESLELDPTFRKGAAKRMLGTLYSLAPASLLQNGDSERGLEMLEEQVDEHPLVIENQLRVAEAYIALDDPEPALGHLCLCANRRKELRKDDQRLLDSLIRELGGLKALECE